MAVKRGNRPTCHPAPGGQAQSATPLAEPVPALLPVHAVPGARRSQVLGWHGERVRIALAAPPVEGRANDELLRHLAEVLGLARGAVRLEAGASSRRKRVAIDGRSLPEVLAALGLPPAPPA